MKPQSLLLRVAAAVSSLTLFALFVYSRAGGGSPSFYPQPSRTNAPGPRVAPNVPNDSPGPTQTSGERTVIFSGSKSYSGSTTISGGNLPPPTQPAPPPTERQRTVLFSGPKAGILTVNESASSTAQDLKPVPPSTTVPKADDPEFAADTDTQFLVGTLPRQQVEKPVLVKPLEPKPQLVNAQVERPQPSANMNNSGNAKPTEKRQVIMGGSKSMFVPPPSSK